MTGPTTTGRAIERTAGPWSAIRGFVEVVLTQTARDRSSFFFMLVLPIAIMVIIGSTFGGPQTIEIAVVDGGDEAFVAELARAEGTEVTTVDDLDAGRRLIRRFDVEGVVDWTGAEPVLVVNDASGSAFAVRVAVERAANSVRQQAVGRALTVDVRSVQIGDEGLSGGGRFSLTAAQNLVLFMFITALTSGAVLVRARTTGVIRRVLAGPTGTSSIVLGLGVAWLVLTLVQAAIILGVGAFGFGVRWGDPVAGAALVMTFGLVGTGAGLLVGALFGSEDQVAAVTPPAALVLAALGGCMVPTEVFSDTMLSVSRLTPHHWALEGWKELIFRDGGVADVADSLAVLTGFAAVLVVAAAAALRRRLVA